jgi:rare lipoprotein A
MHARPASALVAALAAAALLPASAQAQEQQTGGVAAPVAAPVSQAVTASGGGVSLTARPDATVGQPATVRGTAPPGATRVKLQLQDPTTLAWKAVAKAAIARDGTFAARWRPTSAGPAALRAVLHKKATSAFDVTVYKPALATWYGPGFWGNQTACGIPLTPDLLGVAHRTLPCGTLVTLDYQGRQLALPVVDRGPYGIPGAQFDLTQAAAFTLGMTATSTVGALRLP